MHRENPGTLPGALIDSPATDHQAAMVAAFRFLRQPNRPNTPTPETKSGSPAGSGVDETASSAHVPWSFKLNAYSELELINPESSVPTLLQYGDGQ